MSICALDGTALRKTAELPQAPQQCDIAFISRNATFLPLSQISLNVFDFKQSQTDTMLAARTSVAVRPARASVARVAVRPNARVVRVRAEPVSWRPAALASRRGLVLEWEH